MVTPTPSNSTDTHPSKSKRSDEPLVRDTWTSGNFEAITSDNVIFRVDDYVLYGASEVFANMLNVSSGEKKITLPDTSAVFESFLKVARTGEIDIPYDLNGIKDLLLFLKKWDCPAAFNNVQRALLLSAQAHSVDLMAMFHLAASTDNNDLAQVALRQHKWWDSSAKLVEGKPGSSTLDPRGWPLRVWRNMSNIDYYFALSRAYSDSADKRGIYDHTSLVNNFNKYLQAAKQNT